MDFIYLPHIPCTSVLYNILIKFGIPGKLVGLIKKCLNETCNTGPIGRNLSDTFPLQDGLKQGDDLSPFAFQLCFEICHQKVSKEPGKTDIEWDTSVLAYADKYSGRKRNTTQKHIKALSDASKEFGLEMNPEKTKLLLMTCHQKI
jgi:hypothetical protein